MRQVAERVKLFTDIPVSVGIAPTKTLAKVANKFAKKYEGYRGVCVIDTEAKRQKAKRSRKCLSGSRFFSLSVVWPDWYSVDNGL